MLGRRAERERESERECGSTDQEMTSHQLVCIILAEHAIDRFAQCSLLADIQAKRIANANWHGLPARASKSNSKLYTVNEYV